MDSLQNIKNQLNRFIVKYYKSELIKGMILFLSFGLLFLLFTLLIEYLFWLPISGRTILFTFFILVELSLLVFYIFLPLIKILGFKRGLDNEAASKIIGDHFDQVDDKLLNIIQLDKSNDNSELLQASIKQKSNEIDQIKFSNAISFKSSLKFSWILIFPILFISFFYFTNSQFSFFKSYERIINFKSEYQKPAPFRYELLNDSLTVIEGNSFKIQLRTEGDIVPEKLYINYNGNNYLLSNSSRIFEYTFNLVSNNFDFNFTDGLHESSYYELSVLKKPVISSLSLEVIYPKYTGLKSQLLNDFDNISIPYGSKLTWNIDALNTEKLLFVASKDTLNFKQVDHGFQLEKQLFNDLNYEVITSNNSLSNFEKLEFNVNVTNDQYPEISIETDSLNYKGTLSDDYGLSSFYLVYSSDLNKQLDTLFFPKPTSKNSSFKYDFPNGLSLDEGVDYEYYFEVRDNDPFFGFKKTKSKVYNFHVLSESERIDENLKDQYNSINNINSSYNDFNESLDKLDEYQKSLSSKSNSDWKSKKKLNELINQHENKYEDLLKKNNELEELLNEFEKDSSAIKKDLEERIKETQELLEKNKELDELKRLSDKLNNEQLSKELRKLSSKSKNDSKNIERLLELTKKYYHDQVLNKLQNELKSLSKELDSLSNNNTTQQKQDSINKAFDKIDQEYNDLKKESKEKVSSEHAKQSEETKKELNKASENISSDNKSEAKKNQKSASKKMQQMQLQMSSEMKLGGGGSSSENEEDIAVLRSILENLNTYSFKQEDLIYQVQSSDQLVQSNFLKTQNKLKTYFEHIDDSLYALSLRQPSISTKIISEVSDVQFYISESILHLEDNKVYLSLSDQQHTITHVNNLSLLLSMSLDNMMASSMPMPGQGSDSDKGLPDIIKGQSGMTQKMQGMNQQSGSEGEKKGSSGENGGEGNNGESVYDLYKQQYNLRKDLESKYPGSGISKSMESLEKELLNKGVTDNVISKSKRIEQELLKLQSAKKEEGLDNKRLSKSSDLRSASSSSENEKHEKDFYSNDEILNRSNLSLEEFYKKLFDNYNLSNDSIQ